VIDAEEQSVRDILGMFSTGAGRLERYLAAVIARRCKSPHHFGKTSACTTVTSFHGS